MLKFQFNKKLKVSRILQATSVLPKVLILDFFAEYYFLKKPTSNFNK